MQVYIAFCAGSICGVWEGRRTHDEMERRNPICDWVTSNLCLSIKTALAAKMTALCSTMNAQKGAILVGAGALPEVGG